MSTRETRGRWSPTDQEFTKSQEKVYKFFRDNVYGFKTPDELKFVGNNIHRELLKEYDKKNFTEMEKEEIRKVLWYHLISDCWNFDAMESNIARLKAQEGRFYLACLTLEEDKDDAEEAITPKEEEDLRGQARRALALEIPEPEEYIVDLLKTIEMKDRRIKMLEKSIKTIAETGHGEPVVVMRRHTFIGPEQQEEKPLRGRGNIRMMRNTETLSGIREPRQERENDMADAGAALIQENDHNIVNGQQNNEQQEGNCGTTPKNDEDEKIIEDLTKRLQEKATLHRKDMWKDVKKLRQACNEKLREAEIEPFTGSSKDKPHGRNFIRFLLTFEDIAGNADEIPRQQKLVDCLSGKARKYYEKEGNKCEDPLRSEEIVELMLEIYHPEEMVEEITASYKQLKQNEMTVDAFCIAFRNDFRRYKRIEPLLDTKSDCKISRELLRRLKDPLKTVIWNELRAVKKFGPAKQ